MSEAYEILGGLTDVAKICFGPGRGAVTYRVQLPLCVADSPDGWKLKGPVTETMSHDAMMAEFEGPRVDDQF
ncbi:hypothetical protein LB505_002950 [Fusarium chuoi]|nr:hypothetical protein LB505_002950 [Fusarium chuoi]